MKVLIYNKSNKIGTQIVKELETYGYENVFINNEYEIYEKLKYNLYDLIVVYTDYVMAVDILISKIRKLDKKVYVLAVCSMNTNFFRKKALELGFDDYIDKNCTIKEISLKIVAVCKIINRYLYDKNIVLSSKDLVLNGNTRTVKRSGVEIKLSKKEFELLEYLLQNKNNVVTRTMIAEKIWDIDVAYESNIVDVYINFLRKKIDKDYNEKIIKTIRGIGYIINEEV